MREQRVLEQLLGSYKQRVEQILGDHLQSRKQLSLDPRLHEAMHYSLLSGGKRLRPVLLYAANQACAGQLEQADRAACAVEALHSYSLVHDDLPAMDDDDLRRGQPTCHIQFDEATAILAGDALLTWSFQLLSESKSSEPAQIVEMIRSLAEAAGDLGMVGGQSFDLKSAGEKLTLEELRNMHRAKTGALISVSLRLGALSAQATDAQLAALESYGSAIGLAFQIKDDLLDIESDTDTLGKPQGSDIAADKPTYPALIGVEESRIWLEQLKNEALDSLRSFPVERAEPLKLLAQHMIDRIN